MSIQPKNGAPIALSILLDGENVAPYRETNVASCGRDSNEPLKGGVFVCLDNDPDVAKKAIDQAKNSGALVAVVANALEASLASEQDEREQDDAFQLVFVDDPRSVWARSCQAFRGFPARKMKMVAVTGTSGKTSLSYVLGGVLAEAGQTIGLIGSLGVYDGSKLSPLKETTPEPERLADLLDMMATSGCVCVILEVSSVALAEKRIAGIEFDAVCLTNLRRDHLDYHRTVDQYRRVKMQIFSYLKESGLAICNVDDRVTDAALHLIARPTLTVGIQPTNCSVSGTPVERQIGEQTFYIVAGSDAAPIHSRVIGKEHIYNCLETAALAIAWDVDLKTVARGIERVNYIPGRMERVDCGQPFGVFLDRANSPESLEAALENLRRVTPGKLYCVLCAPDDDDRSKRPLIGRVAESNSDLVIVTSGNSPKTQMQEAFDDLKRGFERIQDVNVVENRKKAIEQALSQAVPEDCVLIVGQDVSTLDEVNENFVPDRQFVRRWLYENQPCADASWFN